jgi:hypothetical protein
MPAVIITSSEPAIAWRSFEPAAWCRNGKSAPIPDVERRSSARLLDVDQHHLAAQFRLGKIGAADSPTRPAPTIVILFMACPLVLVQE